jgi:low temperature requirement protein LtrA
MPRISRPFGPRNTEEPHRAATPLELLFDLVSVIAIASAAAGLHHSIAEAHYWEGIATFLMAFFAIWWAWMNYTWFASAYDNDDVLYRLLTMVIMVGALTMAAGIGRLFKGLDLSLVVTGYVVMRFAMVALWLRAAAGDTGHRHTARRYAAGIAVVQLYWIGFYLVLPVPDAVFYALFLLGAVFELAVPVIAEKSNVTPWHRHHIMERYGLLNIIVLGETLLAGSFALQAIAGEHIDDALMRTALSAVIVVFAMWWLYFSREDHLSGNDIRRAFLWGYGHFVIFASGAAVGAGFAVLVDVVTHHAEISHVTAKYAVAVPVCLYLLGLWFVRDRFLYTGLAGVTLPMFGLLILLAPLTPVALEAMAVLTVLAVVARNLAGTKAVAGHGSTARD